MRPKKTILCVDDNDQHLSIRKFMLETKGYNVICCTCGKDALAAFNRGGIDLILCDLMMPGLTGMDVFDQISRELPDLCSRFVFMTGGAVTERARKFLDGMPDQRLDKPFRLEQVEALLRRVPR
jgi:CheY-like chemotaxis protein